VAKRARRERREAERKTRARGAQPGDAAHESEALGSRRTAFAVIALLVISVAAIYAPVVAHKFVSFDDRNYILQNPNLDGRLGFDDVQRAFAEPYFANWIPVTSLSMALDDSLYGRKPTGYLVTNAALHAVASILLFLALLRMTGEWLPAACVAGIFAVHPLHVESVAWASQRKDVLLGVFWMATLLAYARYAERPTASRYAWVAAGVALALLSKPVAVTLPLALLLLDVWPLRRIFEPDAARFSLRPGWQRAVLEKLPLLALAALASAVTFSVQGEAGALRSDVVPLPTRVANAGLAYVDYLRDSLWPSGLGVFYPYPAARLKSAEPWLAYGVLLALTAACVALARRRPSLLVGWLWFLGTLVPMIGLIQVGGQARADRYMYVPLVGLSIALVWGALGGTRGLLRARPVAIAACVAVLVALGVAARTQVRHWRDPITLYERALAVTQNNHNMHGNLGTLLAERGDLEGAERHLRESLRIRPEAGTDRVSLGLVLARRGRWADARREIQRGLDDGAKPAVAHAALGIVAEQERAYPQAIAAYREALRHDPRSFEANNNLAWVLATVEDAALRDPAEAVRLAESIRPPNADSLDTLAAAYAAMGRYEDAQRTQERALDELRTNGDPRLEDDYRARLAAYRAGQPQRSAP
jgi:Flp pilus assembly protein TadD